MNNWKAWKMEKNYQNLFWAGTVSGIGYRFTQVATLTLLYQITGSGFAIGILFAIRMAPFLLLAPIGGKLADRFSKKKLLITIDLIRIPFAISPIFVQGPEHLWIVFISAFCLAAGEALYAPARMASIPRVVKQDRLLYVNAIEQIMVGGVLVLGSSSGGIISYLFGLHVPFFLDGISFLLSAFFLSKITPPAAAATKTSIPTQHTTSAWKLIFGSSALIVFLIIELTMPLANGIDNVLMSVYALDIFQMGDLGVGFIYAFLGLGFVLSSFFSNLLKRKLITLIVIFIALEGVGHLILSVVPAFSLALLTILFITFVGGISNICLSTLIMKIVPKSRHGTFFGLTAMVSNTSLGISMGAAGLLLEVFDPRTLSFIVGITYIIFTIVYSILFIQVDPIKEKRNLIKKTG
ncbi:MFS transporter [Virgibacillus profundi]|uniref:MFS transporter n=1 Tax=Virgibacillus profundi TaxID=2024555 RepID=A0A2A2IFA9_9BACI|nr:MFS transporter [Virgibacillus profundi]PAV30449.1 MFS transporter [Virgibacillus profundi]PXY54621.1 MFS transporter [Virgibacillus profundi]